MDFVVICDFDLNDAIYVRLQSPMVSAKVRWYVAYMTPKSKDDGITMLVISLHKYIEVYIVQEFKINQMTAAGCMNEWQIRFLQSEIKKETNGLWCKYFFYLKQG